MLTLSADVHSSLAEIIICQACVHDILRFHGNDITSRFGQKSSVFKVFLYFFTFPETKLYDLFNFTYILQAFWLDFASISVIF